MNPFENQICSKAPKRSTLTPPNRAKKQALCPSRLHSCPAHADLPVSAKDRSREGRTSLTWPSRESEADSCKDLQLLGPMKRKKKSRQIVEVSHICYQYGYIEIAYEDTTDKSSSGLQRQVPSVCKEGQLTKNNLGLPKATDAIFNLPTSRGFVSIFRLDHQKCHAAVPYYLKLCFKEQEESLVGMGLCFAGSWSLVMDGFLFLGRQR